MDLVCCSRIISRDAFRLAPLALTKTGDLQVKSPGAKSKQPKLAIVAGLRRSCVSQLPFAIRIDIPKGIHCRAPHGIAIAVQHPAGNYSERNEPDLDIFYLLASFHFDVRWWSAGSARGLSHEERTLRD